MACQMAQKCPIIVNRQPFVVINVVKSSAMNKTRKEAGIGPYLKKAHHRALTLPVLDSQQLVE